MVICFKHFFEEWTAGRKNNLMSFKLFLIITNEGYINKIIVFSQGAIGDYPSGSQ